jgi:putative thioredoxin
MEAPDIVTADETNFDFQVLEYSERVPVLVNFWARWSSNCLRTNTLLENLARQGAGRFRLAMVDVDASSQLTQRYQVRTVPTLKTFENGVVTRHMEGVKTTLQVIEYIKTIAPSPDNLLVEKAENLLKEAEYQEVEETCLEILENEPDHPRAKLMLAKSLIWQGEYREALTLLDQFPASQEYPQAEKLNPLVQSLLDESDQLAASDDPLGRIFSRALTLIKGGNIPAALDGLLGIIQKDKTYRGGEPRRIMLGVFELLGNDNELTQEYRNLLANTLF